MNFLVVLAYGVVIFIALTIVSIPFGFVIEFRKTKGSPFSNTGLSRLRMAEYVVEAIVLASIIAHLCESTSAPVLTATAAFSLASAISYLIEFRMMKEPVKIFVFRTVVGFVLCVPVGVYLGTTNAFT